MNFGVDRIKAAVIAIDLHRGHLDPTVATMPLPDEQAKVVIQNNRKFLDNCRAQGIPVIHQMTLYRSVDEISSNPFWRTRAEVPSATRKNVLKHNLWGLPGTEVIPELLKPEDWIITTKRRYDCFIGSDLEFTLKKNGINTLLITGVNTNSCVLATTTAACCRDFSTVVIEECVDTMDGTEAHEAALTCIRAAFGWVMSGDEAISKLKQAQETAE